MSLVTQKNPQCGWHSQEVALSSFHSTPKSELTDTIIYKKIWSARDIKFYEVT